MVFCDLAQEQSGTNDDSSANKAAFSDHSLTTNDIAIIRERFHGWEQASAKTLADVFGVSVQRITAIVHSNRPDSLPTTTGDAG